MKAKKLTTALLSVCLLAGSIPAAMPAAALDPLLYGDINSDNFVDVKDAVLLSRIVGGDSTLNTVTLNMDCADVTGDGKQTPEDLTLMLRYLARLTKSLGPNLSFRNETQCLTDGVSKETAETVELSDEFKMSQYTLAANLFQSAMKENKNMDNLMLSPTSVALALGMTANGAKGETLREMEQVIGGGIGIDDLNRYFYSFTQQLKNTENTSLSSANSLWVRDDPERILVPESFLRRAVTFYDAESYLSAFDHQTAEEINHWVSDKTHQMIDGIFNLDEPEPIPDLAAMYLINALAFEAKWTSPYTTDQIHITQFTCPDQSTILDTAMASEEYTYLESDNATGFIKPYKDGHYSFAAILPNEDVSITDYIASLDGKAIADLLGSRKEELVRTKIPQFKFAYSIELKDTLNSLGMETAFTDAADLSGLNEAPLGKHISGVLHKTFISLDSAGTRAGAVTVVVIADNAMPPEAKEVDLNRPFVFMILDEESDLPVFIGAVTKPTEVVPEIAEE